MSNSGDGDRHGNFFEMIDQIMSEMGKTKKMFMLMIITMLLFPSGTLLVATIAVFPIFDDNVDAKLLAALVNGEMTQEEYDTTKKILSSNGGSTDELALGINRIVLLVSVVWLIIGIRQWVILSRWGKRYKVFKKSRDEADKKLQDGDDGYYKQD